MKQKVYRKAYKQEYEAGMEVASTNAAFMAYTETRKFCDEVEAMYEEKVPAHIARELFMLLCRKAYHEWELKTEVEAHEDALALAASDSSRSRRLDSEDEEGEPVPVRRRRVKIA